MTLEKRLIGGIRWNSKNDIELSVRLERVAITLKKKNISSNYLWEEAIRHNSYAVSLAWGKMHKRLPSDDTEMIDLKEYLRKSVVEEVNQWLYIYEQLKHSNNINFAENPMLNETNDATTVSLTDEETNKDLNIFKSLDLEEINQYLNIHSKKAENALLTALYIKEMSGIWLFFGIFELSSDWVSKILKRIEYSGKIPWMLIRLLFVSQGAHRIYKGKLQRTICQKYEFKGKKYENNWFLKSYCIKSAEYHRIFDLQNILTLFPDVSLIQICDKSKEDFLDMAKSFTAPLGGIRFYFNLLKSDGWSGPELLDEVSKLCVFSDCSSEYALNDYVYLCWKLQEYPKDAGNILEETTFPKIPENIQIPSRTMAIFLDETFRALMKNNSDEILKYLLKMGKTNPYLYREDYPFKKSHAWYDGAGKYLPTYMNYVEELIRKFEKQEVIDIYMNSCLKSMIDFNYLIKRLFEKEFHNQYYPFVELSPYLSKYRFVGSFKNNGHNFRVSISSVSSTYLFPIHIKWSTENAKYINDNLTENTPVTFAITHADNRMGMIFAADVVKKH